MLRIFILNYNCLKMHKLYEISDKNMKNIHISSRKLDKNRFISISSRTMKSSNLILAISLLKGKKSSKYSLIFKISPSTEVFSSKLSFKKSN